MTGLHRERCVRTLCSLIPESIAPCGRNTPRYLFSGCSWLRKETSQESTVNVTVKMIRCSSAPGRLLHSSSNETLKPIMADLQPNTTLYIQTLDTKISKDGEQAHSRCNALSKTWLIDSISLLMQWPFHHTRPPAASLHLLQLIWQGSRCRRP